jgi:hypothetical protein
MKNTIIRTTVRLTLWALAVLARRPWLSAVSDAATAGLARSTIKAKRIGTANKVEELGAPWQRSFPSSKQVPIKAVTADTVYAEIHTPCPLRGSGDLHACHRMMNFDRTIVGHAGGQFVVLESQATPGNNTCKVAMRLKGQPVTDLKPAHERESAAASGAR